jgi:hypothetical protein
MTETRAGRPSGRNLLEELDSRIQLLVRASQRENRKLRDIAADIVSRVTDRRDPRDLG